MYPLSFALSLCTTTDSGISNVTLANKDFTKQSNSVGDFILERQKCKKSYYSCINELQLEFLFACPD